jgi:hypothetical protein
VQVKEREINCSLGKPKEPRWVGSLGCWEDQKVIWYRYDYFFAFTSKLKSKHSGACHHASKATLHVIFPKSQIARYVKETTPPFPVEIP